ncbi:MAG: methyltransferase domain-containing protein, partial [bacterium]
GRWSRVAAPIFLSWLEPAKGLSWVDVGCGTGPLSETILRQFAPSHLVGVDLAAPLIATAQDSLGGATAEFQVGDALQLPLPGGGRDLAVSGLLLNFLPDPAKGVEEMRRVIRPGGVVAGYIWDYTEGQLTRHFWDVANSLETSDSEVDMAKRFPLCQPGPLAQLLESAGLERAGVQDFRFDAVFSDFKDYYEPFLGGQGPPGVFLTGLSEEQREIFQERLQGALPTQPDGRIIVSARIWAFRGAVPRP